MKSMYVLETIITLEMQYNRYETVSWTDLTGLGTGELRAHFDEIITGGGRLYLSGMSSKGRGVTDEDLQDKPAEFAKPNVLVPLALDHDRMFTY